MSLATEFLRAVRGKRSQVSFSRRLGYTSNVAAEWESGRREPSAARALTACLRCGIDVSGAVTRFHELSAPQLGAPAPGRNAELHCAQVAAWLRAQRADRRLTALAAATGLSLFQVSRAFSGATSIKLQTFFDLIEATTQRLPEFIATLVDVENVPSITRDYDRLMASKDLAFSEPWTAPLLSLLETRRYRTCARHDDAALARALGIEPSTVTRCVQRLAEAGLIRRRGKHYEVAQALTIDTRSAKNRLALRAHWARTSGQRVLNPQEGDLFSYNIFSVSKDDFTRIRNLQKNYFSELRAIVAASKDPEVVALMTMHSMLWAEPDGE